MRLHVLQFSLISGANPITIFLRKCNFFSNQVRPEILLTKTNADHSAKQIQKIQKQPRILKTLTKFLLHVLTSGVQFESVRNTRFIFTENNFFFFLHFVMILFTIIKTLLSSKIYKATNHYKKSQTNDFLTIFCQKKIWNSV